MKERGGSSASGMFLIELLLAIMIFAIASAICMKVFVLSHQIAAGSNDLNHAVVAAQSGAECFKASSGDLSETANLLGGNYGAESDTVALYFDAAWKHAGSSSYDYILEIKQFSNQDGLIDGEVTVSDISGDLIFSIPVSVLEVAP
jgi:type II secretory pathway pseudopilin PulG